MLFSLRRDSDTRPSQRSSHRRACFLRSISTAVLRPLWSVTNWIPVMASLSLGPILAQLTREDSSSPLPGQSNGTHLLALSLKLGKDYPLLFSEPNQVYRHSPTNS